MKALAVYLFPIGWFLLCGLILRLADMCVNGGGTHLYQMVSNDLLLSVFASGYVAFFIWACADWQWLKRGYKVAILLTAWFIQLVFFAVPQSALIAVLQAYAGKPINHGP